MEKSSTPCGSEMGLFGAIARRLGASESRNPREANETPT
jgi:hypothetical protein